MEGQVAAAWALLPDYLAQHVLLSAAALALGVAISLPLSVLAARNTVVRWPLVTLAGMVQTIPGLALLALFYPLLLALSAVTEGAFGFKLQALGFLPALLALTLYAMLPILRNGVAGLTGIDPAVREAADGVGMTPAQRLLRVEAPLAAPVVMAGVRTAAVWTIGAATLSTPVGQTSLGNYIFSGLQTENWVFVLFGCAAAGGLALIVDQLLGLIEWGAGRRRLLPAAAGLALLGLGTAAAAVPPLLAATAPAYVVGAKNFSEQYILAELISGRLTAQGADVARRDGLGSAIVFRALEAGEIDVYVDYSGTLWTNVIGRKDNPPRAQLLAELTRWMKDEKGVVVLGSLGFENAYALAMERKLANSLGVASLDDLTARAPRLTLGGDLEFLSRPEWAAIEGAYGLRFAREKSFNPTFMYRALSSGDADVISAFSSDGRIAAQDLVVLADPRGAVPSYDAVILISPRRAKDRRLIEALTPLIGAIPVERMREANYAVDRDEGKVSPAEAARMLGVGSKP
ncbi:ABC transporter permease subunit [Caulobacter sp. SLTY]|uniref:ABC transporter permease/substrate-binding protein n=1 Tax=Caulobacter sp. SLTY TaxID=2683262 RepID=UPI0014131FBC|nr:ABC transporter permease/substrate-binding protein [Caulobacter sp. SLTY]NBB14082.1 ABC transporter permease subunit [Caulobacter sp. SLTY]